MSPILIAVIVIVVVAAAIGLYLARRRESAQPEPLPVEKPSPPLETTVPEGGPTVFAGMRLVVANPMGPLAGSCFSIGQDGAMIGRDRAACQIVYDSETVSRQHARLQYGPKGLVLTNVSKTNMTYLNDSAIDEVIVRPGDRIRVSDVTFIVQMDG